MSIAAMVIAIFICVLMLVMGIFYLFEALALYKLSKNRGYQKPWIAFIPVVNAWVLGGIADNIAYCHGKTTRWRVFLLLTQALWSVFYVVYLALMLTAFPALLGAAMAYSDPYMAMMQSGWIQLSAVGSLVTLVSMAQIAVKAVVCYKVYADYNPQNAVIFLVLSILFGLWPFLLFSMRNRVSATLYWKSQTRPPQNYGNPPPYAPPPQP